MKGRLTDVDVRLASIENSVCAVDIEDAGGILLLDGELERVHGGLEPEPRRSRERRN